MLMLRLGMIVDWIHDRSITAVTANVAAVVIPSTHGGGGRDVGWGPETALVPRQGRKNRIYYREIGLNSDTESGQNSPTILSWALIIVQDVECTFE